MKKGKRLVLAKGGSTPYLITIPANADDTVRRAGDILSSYFKRVSNAVFPVLKGHRENGKSIRIDIGPEAMANAGAGGVLGQDAFAYRVDSEDLIISANKSQGLIFAVYDFLEREVGCRYYTSSYEYIPYLDELAVDVVDYSFSPILEYRELYYREYFDQEFGEKHKLNGFAGRKNNSSASSLGEGREKWGFWCHSFEKLVPPEEYFDSHPEYFSLRDGKRVGKNSQLCLTNPEVLNITIRNLKKYVKQYPSALYWSVSQNDNDCYCQCPQCAALDEYDGTPMGSILNFVNKVAAEFPDNIISTLAYWYSRKAPKHTRPADNVHIMLCNIECNRGMPIESDPRNKRAVEELLEWASICGKVFLWDYVIQFSNLVSPFPNLRVLAPNIRFFVKNNVRSLFSQANREWGGEFHELRGYMLAKLMWNPECDEEVIMRDFLNGYYGLAAQPIYEYIQLMHDALDKTGGTLSIFGSPQSEKDTFLTEDLMHRYAKLFDNAECAVSHDEELMNRVVTARLPLYYAQLQLGYGTREERLEIAARFADMARKTGLEKVEEWKITVDQYITDTLARLAK